MSAGTDAHRDNEVRTVLSPLAALVSELGFAVVLVCHTRKSSADFADDTVLGSRAFTGLARSVWHISDDSEDSTRKLLLPGKCNLAVAPTGLVSASSHNPTAPGLVPGKTTRWIPMPMT